MTTIRRIFLGVFVLVSLVTVTNQVSAAPLFYDESVSGEVDLTYSTSPFLLDLGVNRILGTLGCCVDFDSFAFDIPAGLQLAQVDLLFREVALNYIKAYAIVHLDLPECAGIAVNSIDATASGQAGGQCPGEKTIACTEVCPGLRLCSFCHAPTDQMNRRGEFHRKPTVWRVSPGPLF